MSSVWLTLADAAKYTQLSSATLLRAVKRRELQAFKVSGKRVWRFRSADIDAWLASHPVLTTT